MLPFVRMLNYGNTVEVPKGTKMQTVGRGRNSNGGGNWAGAILGNDGTLYGMGNTKKVAFGVQTPVDSGLEAIRTNVKDFWLLNIGCLVLDNNGKYFFCGQYSTGLFTNASTTSAPFTTDYQWVDVSAFLTKVGTIVDAIVVSAYNNGPVTWNSGTFTSKYEGLVVVLNDAGEIWYNGPYGLGMINEIVSYGQWTVGFVKDTKLTQKVKKISGILGFAHNSTYYTDGYQAIYAQLEDGSLVGKGTNSNRCLTNTPGAYQNLTAWTEIVAPTTDTYHFDSCNEGILFTSGGKLLRNGTGGGYSVYISGNFYYYQNYNVGMSSTSVNSLNTTGGDYKKITTGSYPGAGLVDIPTTQTTRIHMSFCGTVLYERGSSVITVAHGVYSDYFASPTWSTGAVANFTPEDIGIDVYDAMYVGGTLYNDAGAHLSYGLVVMGTDGKIYWRGIYKGVTYATLTEIQLTSM
ncbi:hypothetical protein EJP02_500 [Escherichia phage EJP2]|nr:hypothetical protein EJP02_500 [Escherichia phage EJP2]